MQQPKYALKKRYFIGVGLIVLLSLAILVACNVEQSTPAEQAQKEPVRSWLLVRAPDEPLPLNKPITVKARTEDTLGVSHVELYAVQLPDGTDNLLLDSQPAPLAQTSFTSEQTIIPTQKGHYAIKVVGYNKQGNLAETETISFDVE